MRIMVMPEVEIPHFGPVFTVKIVLNCDHNHCVAQIEHMIIDRLTIRQKPDL